MGSPVAAPSETPAGGDNKRKMLGLAVAGLAIAGGVAYWLVTRNGGTGSAAVAGGVLTTKSATMTAAAATTKAATTAAASGVAKTTTIGTGAATSPPPVTCTINGIDVCNQAVFLRSTTEDGLGFPRLHNDVSSGATVRAANVTDQYAQWKLKRLANNNFQFISQASGEALRVLLQPNGPPAMVSCNSAVAYDLTKLGADGVCAEFTITRNIITGASVVSIPSNYPASSAGLPLGLSGSKVNWGNGLGADLVLFKAGLPSDWTFEKV